MKVHGLYCSKVKVSVLSFLRYNLGIATGSIFFRLFPGLSLHSVIEFGYTLVSDWLSQNNVSISIPSAELGAFSQVCGEERWSSNHSSIIFKTFSAFVF